MQYQPKNFSDLFRTQLGANLWDYLQRPAIILAMEIATKLHRPAVEAVGDDLIREFGDAVRDRRIKQLVGHMVRQILESRGYALDAQRVIVRFDDLFSTGSRYRPALGQKPLELDQAQTKPLQLVRTSQSAAIESTEVRASTAELGWAAWGGTESS